MLQDITKVKNEINATKKIQKELEASLALLIKKENTRKDVETLVKNHKAFTEMCSIFKGDGHCLQSTINEMIEWMNVKTDKFGSELESEIKKEVFKNIKGYNKMYDISNKGRIYNKVKEEFVKTYLHKQSNKIVAPLCINGNPTTRRIHILIAKCFVPNPNSLNNVRHIDGDFTNNSPDNLEWYLRLCNHK